MPVVRCAYCRKFPDRDSAERRGVQSFCNNDCFRAYADGGPKRKTRVETKKKSDIPLKVRRAVLKADNSRCRWCGASNGLSLHHVVYRGQVKGLLDGGHYKHNLLTLCIECHQRIHSDKKRYQPIALALIWLRETTGDGLTSLHGVQRLLEEQNEKS